MTAVGADSTGSAPISVTADVENGSVRGSVDLNASPDRVFRAIATSEQAEWWGEDGVYRTHDYEIDLREGGKWKCNVTAADGTISTVGGEYITVDAPKILEYTWAPSWEDFESRVRFDIEPVENASRLVVRHGGFEGRGELTREYAAGWERVFGWLAAYLSGEAESLVDGEVKS